MNNSTSDSNPSPSPLPSPAGSESIDKILESSSASAPVSAQTTTQNPSSLDGFERARIAFFSK